jgi:broad specificity phosphatase PhoE
MPTKLILIRHGETTWNFQRRYCGFANVALSDNGKRQAKSLAGRLKTEKIHKIYSSDRKRAIQTAKIIFRDSKIERIPELREIHFGCFEGLTHKQILKKYPGLYKKWLKDPYNTIIPSGEKLADFKKRITRIFKKIISLNPGKTTAVVCHGGSISILITGILKNRNFWKYIPGSASVTVVEYRNGKPSIAVLNDTYHLSPPPAAEFAQQVHTGRLPQQAARPPILYGGVLDKAGC